MTATLTPEKRTTPAPTHGGQPAETEPCPLCLDTGWADAWEAYDGSPPLTWCPACLGAGLEDCDTCDGYGAVPDPVSCPACDGALFPLTA
ncbi:MAG: hypothetical protein R3343_01220 [Nitriliruptorales bacterium]|nr:hypothetical protein [Nitriliruptorales bacterium]